MAAPEFISGADLWDAVLEEASDSEVKRPMWDYPPDARKSLIAERRRRFGVTEEEDTPDPEYH